MSTTPVVPSPPLRSPFVDPSATQGSRISWPWLKYFQDLTALLKGNITPSQFPGLTGDVVAAPGSIATTVEKIQGIDVEAGTPGNGQILEYNSGLTEWIFATIAGNLNVVTKNANYSASPGDVVLCDTTAGGFVITLPSAGANPNKSVTVKKTSTDSNNVTVAATEFIDGGGSAIFFAAYTSLTFVSDGANWWIV